MSRYRYLDPTSDVAFKKVFKDKERLKNFLNAVLRRPEGLRIIELDFVPQEEIPDLGQGKRSIFDLKCKDESGKVYAVEIQNRREPYFLKRVQGYDSHAYVARLSVGDWHKDLMPVIVIAISKTNLFPKEVKYISYHRTIEDETKQQHLFELTYVFIELGKFAKKEEELSSVEDDWLYFLAQAQTAKEPPNTIKEELVLQAFKTIERFNWSVVEYDEHLRAKLLDETETLILEDAYEKDYRKGKQAIEKAKQEGIRLVASNMLAVGQALSLIAQVTGLSKDEILKLKKG